MQDKSEVIEPAANRIITSTPDKVSETPVDDVNVGAS